MSQNAGLNPNLDLRVTVFCSDVYVQRGNLTEAVQGYEKAVTLTGEKNRRTIAHLAYAWLWRTDETMLVRNCWLI